MDRLLIAILGLLLVACSAGNVAGTSERQDGRLTIFAASSLTDAFTELSERFEALNPQVTTRLNFAGSSELATQLMEGAPADLFASANANQMANAANAGLIAGEPIPFLTNRLVVVVPADNPAGLQTFGDLSGQGIRFVSAAPGVPIRDFTEQVLEKAAADPALGPAFRTAVMANLVSEEANVRQLVAKVALGEADAGIVYQSDVTADIAGRLGVIEIPERLNVTAVYPIAHVAGSQNEKIARAFVDLLLSVEGQEILAKWGFGPVPDGSRSN